MARIMVDSDEKQITTEWGYTNKHGNLEYVNASGPYAVSVLCEDSEALHEFYYEDIPKLIKALQAAYDSKQGEKI